MNEYLNIYYKTNVSHKTIASFIAEVNQLIKTKYTKLIVRERVTYKRRLFRAPKATYYYDIFERYDDNYPEEVNCLGKDMTLKEVESYFKGYYKCLTGRDKK